MQRSFLGAVIVCRPPICEALRLPVCCACKHVMSLRSARSLSRAFAYPSLQVRPASLNCLRTAWHSMGGGETGALRSGFMICACSTSAGEEALERQGAGRALCIRIPAEASRVLCENCSRKETVVASVRAIDPALEEIPALLSEWARACLHIPSYAHSHTHVPTSQS